MLDNFYLNSGFPDTSVPNNKDCTVMVRSKGGEFGWIDIPCDESLDLATPICQINI